MGKCSIYFYDIFDTIISRKVQPEYIKKIWSRDIAQMYSLKEGAKGVYAARNEIESKLCKDNEAAGNDLEFRYADMLSSLYERLKPDTDLESFAANCRNSEFAIETRNQYVCDDVVEKIKERRAEGAKIYCVSDFYLPVDFIKEMFEFHGICGLFDGFYISSEYLLTKRSGKLYDYVIKDLALNPSDVLMTGDNKWSDVECAVQHGLNAEHIDRTERHNEYQAFLEKYDNYDAASHIMSLYKKCNRDDYEDLTFSLYRFIEKLYYELLGGSVKNVFFLSREGEFLKKLFDKYQAERVYDENMRIRTHYLMVSRKATLMVSLKPLDEEPFEMIFRQYINISLFDFLSSLGFEESEQEEIGRQLGADIHEKVTDLPRHEIFSNLKANEYFRKLYEEKRTTQHDNFTKYLESFGVDFDKENMCLVDVGWKGTIQDNILVYFGGEKTVKGLYLGLVAAGKESPYNIKKGLLFDSVNGGISTYFDIYNENKSIYEVILGATHGSADHYVLENGMVTVATAQKKEERELYNTLIAPIQKGIYELFVKLDDGLRDRYYDMEETDRTWADIHARLVFLPTKNQIDIFYKIYHFENFGVFEFTKFKTAEHISLKMRCKNFKRMMKERRNFFLSSFWGVVALRDAGLSVFIRPYGYYMYNRFFKNKGERV